MFQKPILLVLFFVLLGTSAGAQTIDPAAQRYRNDQLGSYIHRKTGIMDGNQIKTIFYNNGEVAQWPYSPSGEWPKGSGIDYVDGICMIVTAKARSLRTDKPRYVYPVETFYREEMDITSTVPVDLVNEPWGWTPVPGYAFATSEVPAMSTRPETWPETWPSALDLPSSYDKSWYGYFGRDKFNADLETFFVMDDSKDAEWTKWPNFFFPIVADAPRNTDGSFDYTNGKKWYDPTIRKGLGLRVETRGFQYVHPLAQDIIFWHYDISNLSDQEYDSTFFGFYTDTGIGGEGDNGDDNAGYDADLDLTWGYDYDGILPGRPTVKLGVYGYAYLESPGNNSDGKDNDNDGIIDERRDDPDSATTFYYNLGKKYFFADEDKDWKSYIDENGDGKWTITSEPGAAVFLAEPTLDDVGKDGVSQYDEPWDEAIGAVKVHIPDLGEGNGLPNQGEPNYGYTDKDESDQIGLTSVVIEELDGKSVRDIWPRNDEVIWNRMSSTKFDTSIQRKNIQILFSSGPFPLKSALNSDGHGRERFSMALLFGEDKRDLVENKKIVQIIYDNNYNFAKPPLVPSLKAFAGDNQVILSWDTRAEESRDPIMGWENNDPKQGPKKDFEGYTLYRSTEPEFQDILSITDSRGYPQYKKWIKRWDKIDGVFGPAPYTVQGAAFYRGDDTGLSHAYVDRDVKNGVTYYYALVSYDEGTIDTSGSAKYSPTECGILLTTSAIGLVTSVGQNTAMVTPNAPAAGYQPHTYEQTEKADQGTGSFSMVVVDGKSVKPDSKYTVVFDTTGTYPFYETTSGIIIRNDVDTLGTKIKADEIGTDINVKATQAFDGIALEIKNSRGQKVLSEESVWVSGDSKNLPTLSAYQTPTPPVAYGPVYYYTMPSKETKPYYKYFGGDYEIEFFNEMVDTSLREVNNPTYYFDQRPVNFKIKNLTNGKYVEFITWIPAGYKDSVNLVPDGTSKIIIVERTTVLDEDEPTERWPVIVQYGLPGDEGKTRPKAGDKFRIRVEKKFVKNDRISFVVKDAAINASEAKSEMKNIKVVPNPYVTMSEWEPRQYQPTGRGERRIDFINLPSKCTIRIYTLAGHLVKTIEKEATNYGAVSWNLVSDDDMDVAYGLYIFHVDAPGVGEHIGKFALIK